MDEAERAVCDGLGNCLPRDFGKVIPMISFAWSVLSVVLEVNDGLQLDDKFESFAYILPNFMARTLIIILVLSFLKTWTVLFLLIVLGSSYLFLRVTCPSCLSSKCPDMFKNALTKMSFYFSIPKYKNKLSSMLASLPLPLLLSEDVSLKERGVLESEKDRKQSQRCLSLFSLSNMMVFLPLSYIPVYIITNKIIHTDPNVIISPDQLHQIFLYIVLPLAGLAVLASLLVLLSPVISNDKLKKVLLVLVIVASVVCPAYIGRTNIEESPTSVLIFVQNDHCVTIFEGRSDQAFDIGEVWSFSDGKISTDDRTIALNRGRNCGMEISFESAKFTELADNDNVYIEEATDIKFDELPE